MSTITGGRATEASDRYGRGHIARLSFGSLCLLAALALFGTAVAAIYGLENNRDSTGYFVTHTHHYQTSSYALSTESLNVGGITGALETRLGRLRITVTSSNTAEPLFVGIATTRNANDYLNRVAHDELRNFNFDPFKVDYKRLGVGAPATLPGKQTFWEAQSTGSGTQTLTWPIETGHWSAVVMNADGGRNVSVDAQLAARLTGAWWLVAAFITLGLIALAGGIALIRSGARRRSSGTKEI